MCQAQEIPAANPASHHACQCGGHQAMVVSDEVTWKPAAHDLDFPAVPFPSRRIYDSVGEQRLRDLVRAHHQRLKASDIGGLYPDDPGRLAAVVEKAANYFVEACGGPAAFTESHGGGCMRTRHLPFSIDELAREIWLRELWCALDEVGFPEELREEFWNWLDAFSLRMVTRRTQREQPRSIPYGVAALEFGHPMASRQGCGCHGRCHKS